nr:hypothetical protein [Tanacetum cinerariifolium]
LLKLAPNSPEAQVFYQYGHSSSGDAPASSPTASLNATGRGSRTRPIGTVSGTGHGNNSGTAATWSKYKIILMGVIPENSLEVLKVLENNLESLKLLKNKLELLKVLENNLESMKLQEN